MRSNLETISRGVTAFFSGLFLLMLLFNGCQRVVIDPEAEKLLTQLEGEGNLIIAARAVRAVPLDPSDPMWQTARPVTVPLVSQTSVVPRTPVFRNSEVIVRALANKKEVGLLLSWSDPTEDNREAGATKFRDAVAVGFPINYGNGLPLPYIGMGNRGRPVNIWHWKASWQVDVDRGYQGVAETHEGMVPDVAPIPHRTGEEAGSPISQVNRKSPVENLLAEGFGTLTSSPSKGLIGKGVWKEGRWNVVIKRPRSPDGTAVTLKKGLVPITFAVWDGSSEDRNGMKGLTRWRFLRFEGEGVPAADLKLLFIGPIPGADPVRGKQLVTDMGCISCHNLPESPAARDVGPDLTHAGAIHRPEYLLESIKDPNAVIVPAPGYFDPKTWTSTMPSFGTDIPEKDYNDLAEYLRGLQ